MGGTMPALIQWADGCDPARALAESGCTLTRLDVLHPDAGHIEQALSDIGLGGNVRFERPAEGSGPSLRAHILTPAGPRIIPPACGPSSRSKLLYRSEKKGIESS
jgi:hypothetical protein